MASAAYTALDDEAAARIASVDEQTTTALTMVNAYMPTLENLASLLASYYSPAQAQFTDTQFDQTGVVLPDFTELESTDDKLQEAGSVQLGPLRSGAGGILADQKEPLNVANTALETAWADARSAFSAVTPATAIPFSEDDYVAEIIDSLQDKLTDALEDAPGASTASENTYYLRDAQRRLEARQKELTDTMDEFAGRGFTLPASVAADLRSVIVQKQNMDEADRARTVILQQSTLSEDNKWKAIESGLRYDQILISFFERKQQRALQFAVACLKVIQDIADLGVLIIGERMAVQKDYIDMAADGKRLAFDDFRQNAAAFEARLDALIQQSGYYRDAYSVESQVFSMREKALGENRRFVIADGETNLKTSAWNLDNSLKSAADNARAFEATAGVRLKAATQSAEVQIGLAESARNSISTIIGILTKESVAG